MSDFSTFLAVLSALAPTASSTLAKTLADQSDALQEATTAAAAVTRQALEGGYGPLAQGLANAALEKISSADSEVKNLVASILNPDIRPVKRTEAIAALAEKAAGSIAPLGSIKTPQSLAALFNLTSPSDRASYIQISSALFA